MDASRSYLCELYVNSTRILGTTLEEWVIILAILFSLSHLVRCEWHHVFIVSNTRTLLNENGAFK